MTDLRTPEQWQEAKGYRVHDPDGWRLPGAPAWDQPISELEFDLRAATSTITFEGRVS
jgi:hypothetical protein